jgi:hypothetical protein
LEIISKEFAFGREITGFEQVRKVTENITGDELFLKIY